MDCGPRPRDGKIANKQSRPSDGLLDQMMESSINNLGQLMESSPISKEQNII